MTAPRHRRHYRYYDLVMAAFVTVLLCANLIGVSKVTTVAGFTFSAGNLFFPISYLFGDILTEVYGFARSRRVVWAGFGALAFASFMSTVVVNMPPAAGWEGQAVIEAAFGSTWRIALASLIGSGMGIVNPWNLRLIIDNAKVPIIVDAGVGTASDATIAMELGCDGVLMNTAIAHAQNPVLMASAMKKGIEAGREAYLAGRMPRKLYSADPSSPTSGLIGS